MSGRLHHSPARIIRSAMVNMGLGVEPSSSGNWPVYSSSEPDNPDNCITVYNTDGIGNGRTHNDGEIQEHYGIQIRVRSTTPDVGYDKAAELFTVVTKSLLGLAVSIGNNNYCIHSLTPTSGILDLKKEPTPSKRSIHTINMVVDLKEL